MAITASMPGGVKHGLAVLSHSERAAAQNALDKLNASRGGLGLHPGSAAASATVFGGVKSPKLDTATLIQGQGRDTFMSGAHSLSTYALANVGNDTVVSGSTAEPHTTHSAQSFALNSDTINVQGATAESVQGTHPEGATTSSHTVTLSDKTTVTIAGLSHHDIGKLPH